MTLLSLTSPYDLQLQLAQTVCRKRKALKLSRDALAKKSTVPSSTIKKFETTGQISLRQFILLWNCVDSLGRLADLCTEPMNEPKTIDDVLLIK